MSTIHNKQTLWQVWQRQNARPQATRALLRDLYAPDVVWHGFQPLRHLDGRGAILDRFWSSLLRAIPDLLRRPYLFIAGEFEGQEWVASTGEFIGTSVGAWHCDGVSIPASGASVKFRYGQFCRFRGGRIAEIRMLIDLPDLLRQVGITLLPRSYGRDIWIPGPLAGDGIRLGLEPAVETKKTLVLVEAMIFGGLNSYDGRDQESQGLERFWHPHMVWHGPVGIGSAYGLDEFKRNAQGPIVRAFPDRRGPGHQARITEGFFAASTGWPSLVGTHMRDYMGWPPTREKIGWNIMDFWKRDGDLLLENWNLIDLIGAASASGIDLLAKLS